MGAATYFLVCLTAPDCGTFMISNEVPVTVNTNMTPPAVGPEFRVNSYTTNDQGMPSVASDQNGNFVVVWQSLNQDGSSYGVFGQRYGASGTPLGPEFPLALDLTIVSAISAVMITLAALSFRRKE
jgi:hypothetical protein